MGSTKVHEPCETVIFRCGKSAMIKMKARKIVGRKRGGRFPDSLSTNSEKSIHVIIFQFKLN